MTGTVDALLPLSLLHAVRDVDRVVVDPDTEFVDELRNKRFGLSDTVYAQIRRYGDSARRRQRAAADEVAALARLIGRRPDAEQIFRAAGQFFAERAYQRIPATTRRMVHGLPDLLSRRLALRQVRRLARRYFAGSVSRSGAALVLEVTSAISVPGGDAPASCAYYDAGLRELLRLLAGTEGVVEHVRCSARAEGQCQWRVALG
jgi:bacteriochlorophyll 4-vinyl reductase